MIFIFHIYRTSCHTCQIFGGSMLFDPNNDYKFIYGNRNHNNERPETRTVNGIAMQLSNDLKYGDFQSNWLFNDTGVELRLEAPFEIKAHICLDDNYKEIFNHGSVLIPPNAIFKIVVKDANNQINIMVYDNNTNNLINLYIQLS